MSKAIRIARGDYSRKVKVHGQDELGQLAETFNQLAERIEEAQDTMEAERNRLDSVLSHMTRRCYCNRSSWEDHYDQ